MYIIDRKNTIKKAKYTERKKGRLALFFIHKQSYLVMKITLEKVLFTVNLSAESVIVICRFLLYFWEI